LIESAGGPSPGESDTVGELTASRPTASDPARDLVPYAPSRGLFVLVGFVCGDEAGEETRAGARVCWCMTAAERGVWRSYRRRIGGRGRSFNKEEYQVSDWQSAPTDRQSGVQMVTPKS
jgi:hypothetical protein